MLKNEFFIKNSLKSQASVNDGGYVQLGYGQLEPNHLSAQRNGQIYAQLPAAPSINILEQGQFVKYDYAANGNGIGEVNFTGAGEWMLVYNETKLYREEQLDCEFAMTKDNYQARVYTPYDWENPEYRKYDANGRALHTRYLNGVDHDGNDSETITYSASAVRKIYDADKNVIGYMLGADRYGLDEVTLDDEGNASVTLHYDDVTAGPETDIYELYYNEDPYTVDGTYVEKKMRPGTTMVPRVFKTMPGDLMTINLVKEKTLAVGDDLTPGADGILAKIKAAAEGETAADPDMIWRVVKVYTMPDSQPGVKVMRIK